MIYLCNHCLESIKEIKCSVEPLDEDDELVDLEFDEEREFLLSLQEVSVDTSGGEPEMIAAVSDAEDEDLYKYASLIERANRWFCPKCGQHLPLYITAYVFDGTEITDEEDEGVDEVEDGVVMVEDEDDDTVVVVAVGSSNSFERRPKSEIMRAIKGLVEFAQVDTSAEPKDFADIFQWEY